MMVCLVIVNIVFCLMICNCFVCNCCCCDTVCCYCFVYMVTVIVVFGMVMVICLVCILIGNLVFCSENWFVFVYYNILVSRIVFSVIGMVIVIWIWMSMMI